MRRGCVNGMTMFSGSCTRRSGTAVLALVVCAGMWSLGGPLIKLLDGAGGVVAPTAGLTISFYRCLFGGLCFVPWAMAAWPTRCRVRPAWFVASVASFTVMTVAFVLATMHTTAANAIILQYTSPLWVFLLSPLLLGERPSLAEGGVLLVAMVGAGIILLGDGGTNGAGLATALVSGLGYGILTVILRRLRAVGAGLLVCVNCLGSAVLLVPVVAWFGSFGLTGGQLMLIALLGIVQVAVPYALFSWALQHIEAHRAALILLIEVVLNPILTYLVVGEQVSAATLLGGPLILLSVVGWILLGQLRPAADVRLPGGGVRRNALR